jgi:integrase
MDRYAHQANSVSIYQPSVISIDTSFSGKNTRIPILPLPISRYMLHHLMQTYGELAGLPVEKRKFHCLKHSIATHLLDAGADLAFVKDWLGHANIQNTTIYARLTTATLDSTARKVFASHRVV